MASSAATRKVVTILFCDLVDSTALGERLDPEALRVVMSRWYDTLQAPLERHGGTIEKFIGDAVMAVFGIPQAHEDDALRAVRAGLELQGAVDRLNRELGTDLRIRIGIASGEVVTGDGRTSLVTGDAVNTAKRLEEAAAPGEVLIGAATRLLVANATEVEPVRPVVAKGKQEPVEAWRAVAAIPGAVAVARRLDAPLVGRRHELAFLRAQLAEVTKDRACRIVTVFGTAGIGKSRLAAELLADVEARSLFARCLPYGDGITFLPLVELVHSAGGEEAVAALVRGEPDGALIEERIRGALGAAGPASTEEAFWAIRRLLETLARERPLVVCLEDVHWAEPTFLDLLEYVSGWSSDASILLLCLARPELLESRPRWGGAALTLAPLTDTESQRLLDALGDEWPLAPQARTAVAEAAEGNPLFLEQMVAMLAEGGDVAVPPSIQALLAARLDSLEPIERAVLERAAVVGREFWRGAVAELSTGTERPLVAAALLSLVRKELVRPEASTFLGDDGFRFRHALIRDAAYAAIPKAQRAALHETFADWLGRRDGEDEIVGYHLEQAHHYRAELGTADPVLARRAGELLAAAGGRATARGDAAAALTLLRRSIDLLGPEHPQRPRILRELSAAYWTAGDADVAAAILSESIDAACAAGDTRLEWYGRLELAAREAAGHMDTGPLVVTAMRAAEVFAELDDDLGLAQAWRRLGLVAHTESRFADAAEACERALAHARTSGDEQESARAADGLCTALLFGPTRVQDAIERTREILGTAGPNTVLRAHVSTSLAGLLAMAGEFDEARTLSAEAGAVYEELGLRLPRIGWTEIAAEVELLAGDRTQAKRVLRLGQELLDDTGSDGLVSVRAYHAASLALLLAADGEAAEARQLLHLCEQPTHLLGPQTSARACAARALLAEDAEEAERLAREAVDAAGRTDDLNLQGVVELTLARVAGDGDAADAARRAFEAKGNVAAAANGLLSLHP